MESSVKQKKYRWGYGALAAALTACAAVLIFSFAGRLIGGGYTFMCGDLTEQFVPFITSRMCVSRSLLGL